jgi:DNA-binding PadR family transcriptional regulator
MLLVTKYSLYNLLKKALGKGAFFVDKGWVKLHRRILENHFLMHDEKAFCVFLKLLMLVGKQKGQWSGGRIQLSEWMDMNPNTLYKVLKRLEGQQLISIDSNNRYTIYTICNWHKYQTLSNSSVDKPVTAQQQRGNSAVTTREHSNKNKKEKKNKEDVVKKETNSRASRSTVTKVRKQLKAQGVI